MGIFDMVMIPVPLRILDGDHGIVLEHADRHGPVVGTLTLEVIPFSPEHEDGVCFDRPVFRNEVVVLLAGEISDHIISLKHLIDEGYHKFGNLEDHGMEHVVEDNVVCHGGSLPDADMASASGETLQHKSEMAQGGEGRSEQNRYQYEQKRFKGYTPISGEKKCE